MHETYCSAAHAFVYSLIQLQASLFSSGGTLLWLVLFSKCDTLSDGGMKALECPRPASKRALLVQILNTEQQYLPKYKKNFTKLSAIFGICALISQRIYKRTKNLT